MESSSGDFESSFNAGFGMDGPSSSPSTSQAGEAQSEVPLIKHEVTKLDTLAGLAIKYNVSVGDIKRANGLLSDSAMYARGTILIPTSPLPIREELQRICAQVLTGASRDPVLHSEMQAHPASAAVARIATSLNVINGQSYPADLPVSECAWIAMCQCGPMDPNGLCARNLQPIELELTDRSSEGHYLPPASAGPTRQHDAAVRRRRNQADDEGSNGDSASSHGWTGGHREAHRYPYGTGGGGGGGSEGGKIATWFTEIGRAIEAGVSQTVAKVKEAANQPVLARPSSGPIGYGAAADAMLAGRRKGPGSALGRAPFAGGMTSAGGSSGALTSQVMGRGKQGGKDD